MALTEDCFYSQVIESGCCGDQGLLHIPILTVKDIRQQTCKHDSRRLILIWNCFFSRF
jgi:hypothetical protein